MQEECIQVEEKRGGGMPSVLKGLLIGGLIGAGAALLSAPRSGEDTRSMLRERGFELRDRAVETAEEARLRAEELARVGVDRATELKDLGQTKLTEQVAYVQGAVEGLKEGIRTYKQLNEDGITPASLDQTIDSDILISEVTDGEMNEGMESDGGMAQQF
jgi:gas vesicle protein